MWGKARPGLGRSPSVPPTFPQEIPLGCVFREVPSRNFGGGEGIVVLGVPVDAPGFSAWKKSVATTRELLHALRARTDPPLHFEVLS